METLVSLHITHTLDIGLLPCLVVRTSWWMSSSTHSAWGSGHRLLMLFLGVEKLQSHPRLGLHTAAADERKSVGYHSASGDTMTQGSSQEHTSTQDGLNHGNTSVHLSDSVVILCHAQFKKRISADVTAALYLSVFNSSKPYMRSVLRNRG